MSFSDSEHGGEKEYKVFRLLYEMLGAPTADGGKSSWKVLIMDKVTVKVMSHSCKMADITDQGVSLVEDLFRRRQPLPTMDAIYFIQPTRENLVMFLSDMSGREPLYRKAFIFFSSPVQKELVNHIKADTSVLPRIGALREMNLEYFPVDSQAFITDHDSALVELFGEDAEKSKNFEICLNTMATRIGTVFASMKELPHVRYRAPREQDGSPEAARSLIPLKLADSIWQCISKYKSIPNFPQTETCDLLILDRSVDQLPGKHGGPPEKKEVLLEDHDPVWLELRHAHIADASERLHEKMTTFKSKNKAANIQRLVASLLTVVKLDSEMSTRDLQKIVQALPQYNETVEKLTLHVEIAGTLNEYIRDMGLRELGQLEQDLVFGDAGSKEVINLLRTSQDATTENKLRLLMIYAIVYPEKFEGDKATKLMQLAKLTPEDMIVVNNMKYLGGPRQSKKKSSGFSLKFDGQKESKQAARKDRAGEEEETWQLFRFFPLVEELIENLSKGQLPKEEYSLMNEAPPPKAENSHRSSGSVPPNGRRPAHSMRSRRTPTWARGNCSDDGYSSDSVLKNVVPDFKRMGQRIFVFIIGGATRSELRVCHKLTAKLRREVILEIEAAVRKRCGEGSTETPQLVRMHMHPGLAAMGRQLLRALLSFSIEQFQLKLKTRPMYSLIGGHLDAHVISSSSI
ncbi:hypothetical protein V6N12_066592 [Hibiscus sabdariffa]|uniref:Uncharacterized protein n=1 Tax=Hibiscus sabdariffa TaxID=183260 RepID=A0ABR2CQK2_9ROSI